MTALLFSIKPHYLKRILEGHKAYEYRTLVAKEKADIAFLYASSPVKKVLAKASIAEVLALPRERLWEQTQALSGIDKETFDRYFEGRDIAYAYHLGTITPLDPPLELSDLGIGQAPQSFCYVRRVIKDQ